MVVVDPQEEITAFANIVPEYQANEITVDLMRHRQQVENGTMDFLFVSLFQWARQQGYATFNLGMSAIAGTGDHSDDPAVERAIRFIVEHVNQFYNYKGIHEFKEKYHPEWSPRYLIFPGVVSLPAVGVALVRADSGDNFLRDYALGLFKKEPAATLHPMWECQQVSQACGHLDGCPTLCRHDHAAYQRGQDCQPNKGISTGGDMRGDYPDAAKITRGRPDIPQAVNIIEQCGIENLYCQPGQHRLHPHDAPRWESQKARAVRRVPVSHSAIEISPIMAPKGSQNPKPPLVTSAEVNILSHFPENRSLGAKPRRSCQVTVSDFVADPLMMAAASNSPAMIKVNSIPRGGPTRSKNFDDLLHSK